MRIGEYIKYKRQSLGYSQNQLAEWLGVSKQAISKWENCIATPDVMLIPDIAVALKVKPMFLMNAIWIGETGEIVRHFIFVEVKKKMQRSYAVQIYEVDDFLRAKEVYDKICTGQDESVMQTLMDYYEYDPSRTFTVTLSEAVYYAEDEEPYKSLLIESYELNSLIKSHVQKGENI